MYSIPLGKYILNDHQQIVRLIKEQAIVHDCCHSDL
jgi:hypothetical protein